MGPFVDEADGERPAGERPPKPTAESEGRAALDRGIDGIGVGLADAVGKPRRYIGDARPAENFAVALEAQLDRVLCAGPGVLLRRRHPAATQGREHRADIVELFRICVIHLAVFVRRFGIVVPAFDRQLQLLAERVTEIWRAGTVVEHAAELPRRHCCGQAHRTPGARSDLRASGSAWRHAGVEDGRRRGWHLDYWRNCAPATLHACPLAGSR